METNNLTNKENAAITADVHTAMAQEVRNAVEA
jgi:hypothetical protein